MRCAGVGGEEGGGRTDFGEEEVPVNWVETVGWDSYGRISGVGSVGLRVGRAGVLEWGLGGKITRGGVWWGRGERLGLR